MDLPNHPTLSAALKIIATGIALPPDKITSQQLNVQLNKPAGYVERRSGICWRYFASNDASQAELAAEALHNALAAAALKPSDIDLLICASAIAVQALPCSAIHILKAAAMPAGVAGFDINSSCVSFISALEVAAGLLNCGAYRRIAIVSADIASRGIDWDHEESSLIFGDGAACAIVERGDGRSGIIASLIEMYPEGNELCEIRAGGTRRNPRSGISDSDFLFHMQGKPLFTLLAWDFGFYWLHRWHHEMRPLWAVHVVHHQGEHYNLSLGVRNSWYSSLTSIPFFMLLAMLGVPLQVFLAVSIIHYSWQFFNHNALTPKLGWLEKVLITPSHHRVHHLNEKQYADTNYGGTFLLWDKLFGSWSAGPDHDVAYGVKNSRLSCNPMRESNLPFLRLMGFRSFGKAIERRYQSSPWAVGAGVILLFMLVLGYIQQYGYGIEFITSEQAVLFVLLVAGSVALGGMSDGQRWGMILWCSVTLSLLYFILYRCSWSTLLWKGLAGILLAHCVLFVIGVGRKSLRKRYEPV